MFNHIRSACSNARNKCLTGVYMPATHQAPGSTVAGWPLRRAKLARVKFGTNDRIHQPTNLAAHWDLFQYARWLVRLKLVEIRRSYARLNRRSAVEP